MSNIGDITIKVARKKVLWAEINAKGEEFMRIQKQIDDLEQAKRVIWLSVQEKLDEMQSIVEQMDEQEIKIDLQNTNN